jgi:hypothetical protein
LCFSESTESQLALRHFRHGPAAATISVATPQIYYLPELGKTAEGAAVGRMFGRRDLQPAERNRHDGDGIEFVPVLTENSQAILLNFSYAA